MWGRLVLAASLISAFAICPLAVAQGPVMRDAHDAEAHALFEAGREAFADGRYQTALDRFRQAYALSERPELLYNIGHAADRLRRDDEALEAFDLYLTLLPEAANADEVRSRVAAIRVARSDSAEADSPRGEPPTVDQVDTIAVEQVTPRDDVLESWWLWAIVGVGALGVAAGIGVGVAAASSSGPAPGDVGGVVLTLGAW